MSKVEANSLLKNPAVSCHSNMLCRKVLEESLAFGPIAPTARHDIASGASPSENADDSE
jgi:hypothetical protein